MDCKDFEQYLQPYLDGEFTEGEEQEIESHFKYCPVCQQKVAFERWFKRGVRQAVTNEEAPRALRAQVALSMMEQRKKSVPLAWKLAPAMAMALVFAVILFQPRIEISPIVEAAVDVHTKELPYDVQSPDYKTVRTYLRKKTGFAVPSVKFTNSRIELVGGRVDRVYNHSAAYYGFQREGRRYSLVVATDTGNHDLAGTVRRAGNREVYLDQRRGFNVVAWRDRKLIYTLVSDDNESNLMKAVETADLSF